MEDVPNLINIGHTNPIQILNQQVFLKILYMSFKWYFSAKIKKILMSELGLNSKDRKSTRDKTNISNPKVNRGCTPLTADRTSADCMQISLGPSIPYIPLKVYHTGGFSKSGLSSGVHVVLQYRGVQSGIDWHTCFSNYSNAYSWFKFDRGANSQWTRTSCSLFWPSMDI